MYLCYKRTMSQIWQVNTLWQSQSSHHDAPLHQLTVHNQQKYLQVKKIKNQQVCLFCMVLIYTHLAQWNYSWDVLNIVPTYKSDLTQINLSHLIHICMVELCFEFFYYYPYIQRWQYNVHNKYQLHIPYGL